MRNPSRPAAALIALFFAFAAWSLAAQPAKAGDHPWYADSLEKLGFKVFAQPVPLPEFVAETLGGGTASLSSSRGKVLLLNFWATWCPPCQAEMPSIQTLWDKTKGSAFTVMGISIGEKADTVRAFIAKKKYTYPIYLDTGSKIGMLYGASSIPTTYIVDKQGRAIAGIIGGASYDSPQAAAIFAELVAKL
jgi:peroxiredoxin